MDNWEIDEQEIKFIYCELFETDKPTLYCYEKVFEPDLLDSIDNTFMVSNNNSITFPPLKEVWSCCSIDYPEYSGLIIHIEDNHLIYTEKIHSTRKKAFFKYICDQCNNRYFDYNIAINHYIKKHTRHQTICIRCYSKFTDPLETESHIFICKQESKNSFL